MLVAAAVCPCPPLLVPEVASGAAPELEGLRAACAEVLAELAEARPDRLWVVGATDEPHAGRDRFPQGAYGSFRRFGVDRTVRLGQRSGPGDDARDELPLPLAVGAWLLEQADWAGPCEARCVRPGERPEECLRIGAELAASAPRTALLVLGDGSACRSLKAPGYLDERAEPFDASVAAALLAADTRALAALSPARAAELQAGGRAVWQVLAGAAEGAGLGGRLLCDEAPYGVGYFVASWS
ncbi:class III extradiol dioxygenase subunit B-like domain-containing protein [Peterkaempfera sp. SMS 1(5)a]|uniref:class III extradiol dioxygenase subunit B-like domain-containing protein n=1 Tax=Peterkaempfera podocarpi TaxID=3232308 RepID=UPI00366F85B2